MLTIKEMRKAALENVKMNLGSSISLSLVMGLFIMILTSLGAADDAQSALLIVIPFAMMPIIFATQVAHFALQEKIVPSLKLNFRYFMSYFSIRFRGVYSFIKSAFLSLAFFIVSFSILLPISGAITNSLHPSFNDVLYQINEAVLANNVNGLNDLFYGNIELIRLYINIATLPATGIALFVFVYFITNNSIQVYLRIRQPLINSQFGSFIAQRSKATMGRQIRKSYWALNYPLFILLVVGFAAGTSIGSIFTAELNYLTTIGVASAVLLMMFFLPFYFSNMEQIYLANKTEYEDISKKISKDLAANLEKQLNALKKDEGYVNPSELIENEVEDKEEDK